MNPGPQVPNPAVFKSSYKRYTNGERSGEISPPESQHSSMNDSAISNVSSSQEEASNHHNVNGGGGTSISSYQLSEPTTHWVQNATANNNDDASNVAVEAEVDADVNSQLDNNTNAMPDSGLFIQQQQQPHPNNDNGAGGGAPVVPYMYHPMQSPHFYPTHQAAAAIYPPAAPHLPINMNTVMPYKDTKRLMNNNHHSSTSNSYKSLGSSKMATTVTNPNCDMQSAFYMPQPQFPDVRCLLCL